MQQNFQRLGVRSHDDELADTAIQSFGCLVCALLQLFVVTSLPET